MDPQFCLQGHKARAIIKFQSRAHLNARLFHASKSSEKTVERVPLFYGYDARFLTGDGYLFW